MRRRTKKTKDDLIVHALKRYQERYSPEITIEVIHRWNKMIKEKSPEVVLLGDESLTRRIFLIQNKVIAVYNRPLKSICTFLTQNMLDSRKDFYGDDRLRPTEDEVIE